MKKEKKYLSLALIFLTLFLLWTALLLFLDVEAIGPEESKVGFAKINGAVHRLIGVHFSLYTLTDFLSIIPLFFILFFGAMGFWQMLKRKSVFKVDRDLLVLGIFYLTVMAFYVFFEKVPLNYRPVLIGGVLEASYPSSTTLLMLCVMPSAKPVVTKRMQKAFLKKAFCLFAELFSLVMVILRFCSGVHWFSDIVGGLLLSAGLVWAYFYALLLLNKMK